MTKLLNKGKRTITYTAGSKVTKDTHGVDQTVVVTDSIKAGEHKDVPAPAAEKLLRFYPGEVVNIDSSTAMQDALTNKPAKAAPPAVGPNGDEVQKTLPPEKVDKEPVQNVDLIKTIDGLDRLGLINFAEEHKLDIDPAKLKKPDDLKKAILTAYEAKQAA